MAEAPLDSPAPPTPPTPESGPVSPIDPAAATPSTEATQNTPSAVAAAPSEVGGEALDQVSIEELLKQASFEDPSAVGAGPAAEAADFKLHYFQQVIQDAEVSSI